MGGVSSNARDGGIDALVVLELFMQISQVNGMVLGTKIMTMKINEYCKIESTSKRPHHMMHNCVMKMTTVECIDWDPVEERCLR